MKAQLGAIAVVSSVALMSGAGLAAAQTTQASPDAAASAGEAPAQKPHGEQAVAKVGDRYITWLEFNQAIAQEARSRFYHGSVPEAEMLKLRDEVLNDLITSVLLIKDAKARNVEGNTDAVEAELKKYDDQYAASDQWKQQRDAVLPRLREELLGRSRIDVLEAQVRNIPEPSEATIMKFYGDNPKMFTEPVQERVGVILLGVDPSSTRDVWVSAKEEAEKIHEKLKDGGDFESIAKLRSSDGSAPEGGDMGYLHRGMLAEPAQEVVDKMKVGDVSEPVQLLQGYALFKLLDRKEPVLKSFEEARERARSIWVREQAEAAWESYKEALRAEADIKVFDSFKALQEKTAEEAEKAAKAAANEADAKAKTE